jgi:O-antigen ligase
VQGFLQLTLLLLFIFASLAYGAVHTWAYSLIHGVIFLLAGVVFLGTGIRSFRKAPRSGREPPWVIVWHGEGRRTTVLALVLILFTLFQLTPLPDSALQVLSPLTARLYRLAHALTLTGSDAAFSGSSGYLSLDRDKTVKSLLSFSAYVTYAFLLMASLRRTRELQRFALALIAFCVGLSLYGLLRMQLHSPQIWDWKNHLIKPGRVSATFLNPDHFASYLVMAVYLIFGYFLANLRSLPSAMGKTAFRRWLNLLKADHSSAPKLFLLLFLIALTVLSLIYTLSRGGVIAFCVSMGCCLFLLFMRTRKPVYLILLIIVGLFVGYYIQVVGTSPLLEKIEQTRREMVIVEEYGRLPLYRISLKLWRNFPWLGSGLGTVPVIFPMVQSDKLAGTYIPYIHNDWLQLAIEIGWLGIGLSALCIGSVILTVLRRWRRTSDPWGFGFGLAALGGTLAMAIHSLLDFSLRVPGNALFLAILIALGWFALLRNLPRHAPATAKSATRSRSRSFPTGVACLSMAAVFLLLTVQVGRYALAEYLCRTEVDMVNRIQHEIDLAEVVRATELNPLNSEYWVLLGGFVGDAEPSEARSGGVEGKSPAARDALDLLVPEKAGERPEETAYRNALRLSPGRADGWLVWAGYLRDQLERGGTDLNDLAGKTARSLEIAMELSPENLNIREQAVDFFLWRWRVLQEEGASVEHITASVLEPLARALPILMARQPGYGQVLDGLLKQNHLPEHQLWQVAGEKAISE